MEPENKPNSPNSAATNPVQSSNSNPPKLDLFDAVATPPKPPDRTLLMPFSQLVEELTNYQNTIRSQHRISRDDRATNGRYADRTKSNCQQ
ncbi:MAG: hypothetical protein HC849_02725 [Oscillatoriales cyanobacterium RU_3_3]|nr:hypothetical protein [Oscillatoriales cyanobacterium RU_3_3]